MYLYLPLCTLCFMHRTATVPPPLPPPHRNKRITVTAIIKERIKFKCNFTPKKIIIDNQLASRPTCVRFPHAGTKTHQTI